MSAANAVAAVGIYAASAVLVCAGVAKHAVPGPARRAVCSLVPRLEQAGAPLVRAVATIELLTAVGLLVPAVRPVAAVSMAAFGAGFAAVGVAGMLASERTPCGCFGSATGRPFGITNIAAGAALSVVAVLVVVNRPTLPAMAPTVTAALTVALCAWLQRVHIATLIVATRRAALPAETSGVR